MNYFSFYGPGIQAQLSWTLSKAASQVRARGEFTSEGLTVGRHLVGPLPLLGLQQLASSQPEQTAKLDSESSIKMKVIYKFTYVYSVPQQEVHLITTGR